MASQTCYVFKTISIILVLFVSHAVSQSAVNPLQGQGVPPGYDALTGEFTPLDVQVQVALERLWEVNQDAFTFKVSFWLFLEWEDERAAPLINSSISLDGCKKACASDPTPAKCCDKVYIPQIKFANLAAVNRDVPAEYSIVPLDDGSSTITYSTRIFGNFLANSMNFAAYPFDQHFLTVDMSTDFNASGSPSNAEAADYIVIKGKKLGPGGDTVDASGQNVPEGLGWKVNSVSFAPTSLLTSFSAGKTKRIDPSSSTANSGMQFTIAVTRSTRSFYTVLIIIPPCLVVLMAFSTFINPPATPDLRLKTLGTAFLTLNIFFYTTLKVLPGTYALIAPHWLLLISLITILLMTIETLIATNIVKRGDYVAAAKKWEATKQVKKPEAKGADGTASETDVKVKTSQSCSRLRTWWNQLGEKDNQAYRDHVAAVFESWAVPCLLLAYIVAVAILFGVASAKASSSD